MSTLGDRQDTFRLPVLSAALKRGFDIAVAAVGLLCTCWIIAIAAYLARRDTGLSGLFRQTRVGLHGREFEILKVRTMRPVAEVDGTTTTADDPRITPLGRTLRRFRIDELPQLWNVLKGDMSLVGPRPDVPGYADRLEGDARLLLAVRPGITGPATLKYRDEEALLASVDDPVKYNDEVIYPDKVRLNVDYVRRYSFAKDLGYIWRTITGR